MGFIIWRVSPINKWKRVDADVSGSSILPMKKFIQSKAPMGSAWTYVNSTSLATRPRLSQHTRSNLPIYDPLAAPKMAESMIALCKKSASRQGKYSSNGGLQNMSISPKYRVH